MTCSSSFFKSFSASIVAVAILTLAGCGGDSGPVTSADTEFEVDDGENSEGDNSDGAADSSTGDSTASPAERSDEPRVDASNSALASRAGEGSDEGASRPRAASPSKPPVKPAPMAGVKLDEIDVPSGDPAEIDKFIKDLAARQPQGASEEEMKQDFARVRRAIILGAERILESDADEKMRYDAALAKFQALGELAGGLQDRAAAAAIEKFPAILKKDKDAKVASLGRMADFSMQIEKWQGDKNRQAQTVIDALKDLLAGGDRDESTFEAARRMPPLLASGQFDAEADEATNMVREAFKDSKLPEAIDWLVTMAEVDRMEELELDDKFIAYAEKKPDALPALLETVKTLLTTGAPGKMTMSVTSRVADQLEQSHEYDAASQVLGLIGETYAKHENSALVDLAKQISESGATRLGLIGKPLPIEGVLASGGAFSWEAYKGKYVLVDFWATWCVPCQQELPNILANYEKYRDRGFDVVGVNIDEVRAEAISYIDEKKLPWATVLASESDPKEPGPNPNVERCGVSAIPFVALLDREGIVIDIHVRGESLGRKLAELFPEDGAAPTDDPAAAPASEDTGRLPSKTWFVAFDDDNAEADDAETATEEEEEADEPPTTPSGVEVNPYSPSPGMAPEQLVEFILNMQYKPKSIQSRPGFSEAIVEAAERLLAEGTPTKYRKLAVLTKLDTLHKQASLGNEAADKSLVEYVSLLAGESEKTIASDVQFFQLERRVLEAKDLPLDQLPALFTELKDYFAKHKPDTRHLRIASATVDAINRLEEGPEREKHFEDFGKLFAASHDKDLALYGKKLVKTPDGAEANVVGKPLELAGVTAQGVEFDWNSYKGKVVLVDFWATWCGPCRQAMPTVKAVFARYKEFGLEVVGVSLDQDKDALAAYLEDNEIAWSTLAGEKTQELATKYGVRGIPTLMLVGKDGVVVAQSNSIDELTERIRELVGAPPSTEPLPIETPKEQSATPKVEPPA